MKVELIVLSSALALPLAALAQANDSYRCTMGGKVRRVEIFHDAGVAVPCEVHYYKDTEAPGWRSLTCCGASTFSQSACCCTTRCSDRLDFP